MQPDWTLSPSQLNEYVRRQLAADPVLRGLRLRGEISGFKRAASGHMYFSVKDDTARVQCAMFRQNAQRLAFSPADGMRVIARGSASLYPRDGTFQVYVDDMEPDGVGELYRRFEAMKENLRREGLFDAALKRPLPFLPRCVGIVTSRTGAVLHDILRVGWNRYPGIPFVLAPCSVQGAGAAREIAEAILRLGGSGLCDVILCGRGGGSLEDLWAFNEEIVARSIRACRVPVVSCVGHETDFTIADFAADARAATPSAAAEMAVPERGQLLAMLAGEAAALQTAALEAVRCRRDALSRIRGSVALRAPGQMWLTPRRHSLARLRERLRPVCEKRLREEQNNLSRLCIRLTAAYEKSLTAKKAALAIASKTLQGLAPFGPLQRGYALIESESAIIDSVRGLRVRGSVRLRLRDGRAGATITDIEKDEGEGNVCKKERSDL